jgi:hypothetical protein
MDKRYVIEVREEDSDRIRIAMSSSDFYNTTIKVGMMDPIPAFIVREAD